MKLRAAWVIALVLWAVLPSRVAAAEELMEFEAAREAYEDQRYEDAADKLEELVGGEVPKVRSEALLLESRKYLAASYLFLGKRERAKEQFERLLERDPTYQLDPVAFPREVHLVFDEARTVLEARRREEAELRAAEEAERRQHEAGRLLQVEERTRRLRALAETEVVEEKRSRFIAAIPFGVGQFHNGHRAAGIGLGVTSALLAGTSLLSGLVHYRQQQEVVSLTGAPGSNEARAEREQRRLDALRVVNLVSLGLLFGVGAAGAIDAQLRFQPTVRTVRKRKLPPDLAEPTPVELELSGGGARLRVRF